MGSVVRYDLTVQNFFAVCAASELYLTEKFEDSVDVVFHIMKMLIIVNVSLVGVVLPVALCCVW